MPVLTSTIETGKTPTPGIELINSSSRLVTASDLAGKILWYYEPVAQTVPIAVGSVKLLPNGNLVSIIAPSSSLPLNPPAGTYLNVLREYDLAGNTVRELTGDQLNTRLSQAATSGCAECDFTNEILHHEVLPLPNGHFLVLGNTLQTCGASTGCTGDPAEMVLGDVIVDLDQNLNPVWAWNAFNHVPVDRSSFLFPDWTQSNSLAYSPSDGSLLLSSRHLSWVLKIAYANGTGSGNVIWRLGLGGDFTLQGGEAPHDWFNAQHTPTFPTSVTTGVFPLMVFDNGTYRQFSPSNPCGTVALPCLYSTVPTFEINESARTATLVSSLRSPIYSSAGGNAETLPGGNVHFTAAASAQDESDVFEYTPGQAPMLVMHLNIKGQNAYRSNRLGSLYPDITW
jgi:hypothetical protein